MKKINYYARANSKIKILEMICRKHSINLDKEPLFLKYLSGRVNCKNDIPIDII